MNPQLADRFSALHTYLLHADETDYQNTRDWFRLRAKGVSWARLAQADVDALELLDGVL